MNPTSSIDFRRRHPVWRAAASLTLLLLLGCSELFVPDFNNPSLEDLQGNPTQGQLATAAAGILIGSRADYADYVLDIGVLGREALNLDPADPRFVTEMLIQPLDGGSGAFGGDHWIQQYTSIRNANILLAALETAGSIDEQQKEAMRGFAKTIQALDFLLVINTRDTNGAPINVDLPIDQLAPIESKEAVFQHIVTLLDQAQAHLQAGGDAFPFVLPSGFDGFDTPQTFLLFNRALKARVDVYMGNFGQALVSLGESFLVPCGSFELGVYHSHSTAAGDLPNSIFEDPATADIFAHPSLETLAQTQPGGALDRRFVEKTFRTTARTQLGHSSDLTFLVYDGPTAPIPIIRNEELILLRAEANIGLGDFGAALTDINCIRESVGGLAPLPQLTAADALDELLYNKLFSLLFEGGHRWVDARRYGVQLPIQVEGDVVHLLYPIPRDELLARG